MLRILIGLTLSLALPCLAENAQQLPTNIDVESQKALMRDVMKKAENIQKSGDFQEKLAKQKKKLTGAKHSDVQFTLGDNIDQQVAKDYVKKAFGMIENQNMQAPPESSYESPVVLVSFSLGDDYLLNLLGEAHRIGASVAVRGLIDNDMKKTVDKIAELIGDRKDLAGLSIDPTLFQRYNVTQVPTWIMPIEPIKQCTRDGCPTPDASKMVGAVSLQHFLDHVSSQGTDKEKEVANKWLTLYENSKG